MAANLKILILEDNQSDADLLHRELKKSGLSFTSEIVQTREEFENALQNFNPDIILSDYSLPAFDAVTAFRIKQNKSPDIPFIIVSGIIGEENAVELIKKGITDYAPKDKLFTLSPKINRALKDAEERKKKIIIAEKLKIQAVELIIANKELVFQNEEKEKRAAELIITNKELAFQNEEKEKRAAELIIANKELKKAGEELTEKEFFLRESQRAGNIGSYKVNFVKGYWQSSETLDGIFGMGKNYDWSIAGWLEIVHPDDRQNMDEYFRLEVIGKRKSFNKEYRIVRNNDKQTRWVHGYGDVKFDDSGNITDMIGTIQDITEQKNAEENLKQSEKRFRALIEKGDDMITLSSDDGELIYGSPSITRVLGYSVDEFLNKSAYDFIYLEDIPGLIENTTEISQTPGKSFYSQLRLLHKNNNWIWCEVTITNMLHEPGINALVSNFRDISEKKTTEKQMEFDRNNLNALINNTNDLMWSVDRNFNLITSNQPFDEIIKLMSGKTIAKGSNILAARYSPEQLNRNKKNYERAFRGEPFTEIEHTDIPVESWSIISYYPIRKEDEVIGAACHSHDITERKKAEANLQKIIQEFSDYKYALDESSIVSMTDHTGIINYANDNFCRVSNYSREELIGQDHRIVNSGYHSKEFMRNLWKTIANGKIWKGEIRNKAKGGTYYWVDATIVPFLNENEKPYQYIAIRADITQRKAMEETLVQSEKRYRYLFENNPMPIWIIDLNTFKFLEVNEMAILQYGYSREEFLSMTAVDIRPNEEKEHFKKSGHAFEINSTNYNRGIWNHLKKDGTIIQAEIVAYDVIYEGAPAQFILSNDVTEREKAEENLKQSESRLKEAQKIAQIGSWELNFATNIALWSDEACRIYGLSLEENKQTYESWVSFIHPEDLDYVMTATNESQKTLSDTVLNHRIILKDGTIKHVYSKARFEFDQKGKPVGLYGIAHDVTERKLAEEQLRQSEAHLAEAQRLAKMGSWLYDFKADRLTWSEELYNIFDTDKQTFIETHGSFLHLIDAEDREFALQTSRHTQETGEPFTIEYHITTSKGEKRFIQEYGYGQRDDKGKIIRLFGTAQDITEQELSRKQIEGSEKRYRQIVETSHEGILLIDENNKTTFVNKRFCEMFGYSFEEMMGKPIFDLLDEEGKTISKEKIEYRKGGIAESFELSFIAKNGEKIYANSSGSPIWDGNGNYCGALSMITDITARKNAELERLKMTTDLIQRNKDLEQFSYIVSHNLRAPVANIIGLSAAVQSETLDSDLKKEVMEGLSISVKRLDDMIIDLNNILQINTEVSQKKEIVHFSKIANDIYSSIKNLIDERKAVIVWDFSEVEEMRSVKSYIQSIFLNLISNSLKYRRPDIPPLIEIKSCKLNDKIELTFKDNGMGIDLKKEGDQVFGLYKRFHTSEAEGKGIGLYMVKTQVETIGGKISISSEVNKGTVFKIEFAT